MSAAHTPMVVAAARVLCNRMADACEVDYEDSWKTYGDDYLDDAKAALDAAGVPDLLEALQYAVKQVPELATVPGIAAAIAKAGGTA